MTLRRLGFASLMGSLLLLCVAPPSAQAPKPTFKFVGPLRAPRNVAEFEKLFQQVSNWGRWGKEDELATLNLITDAKRVEAASLVKLGISVSLAHEGNAITEVAPDQQCPGCSGGPPRLSKGGDRIEWEIHGPGNSHLDINCHMSHNGKSYNGFVTAEIRDEKNGCKKLGVDVFKNGIVTRGILIDMARFKGVPYLEPGTPVYSEDLDAWEKKTGVRVRSGDAVFLRDGRWVRRAKMGPWHPFTGLAGFHASAVAWLRQRDVALVGSDSISDVTPSGVEGVSFPVHRLIEAAMGAGLFDSMDLDALGETAAKLNRYEFMLTAHPLRLKGGTGSPLNPIATF